MAGFDVDGARKAGYSDAEIADHLAQEKGFDVQGARKSGYSDADIMSQLGARPRATPVDVDAHVNAALKKDAEGMGVVDAITMGAGRTFDAVGRGVQQLWNGATGNTQEQEALKGRSDRANRLYKPIQEAHPIATAVGEALPSLAVPIGGAGGALATAGKLGASAAVPAALSYGSAKERGVNAAVGGAGAVIGGQVLPKLGGMAVEGAKAGLKGLAGKITPEAMALAEKAKEFGIPVNIAQLSDSKFLKTLASSLEYMPLTGMAKKGAEQRAAFTNAVGKEFGVDVPKITPEIYGAEKERLGKQFQDLSARNDLNVTPALKDSLSALVARAEATGNDDTIRAMKNIFGRVTDQSASQGGKVAAELSPLVDASGARIVTKAASETPISTKLPGASYSSIDSELGHIIKGGTEKGAYAKEMQTAIRNAMDESIAPADQALWSQTRSQYKNLKAVRNVVARDKSNGDIPSNDLMNALNNTEAGKEAMAMGVRGNMGTLGQIGQRFVRDQVPNSGTAQRAIALGLIGGGGTMAGADHNQLAMLLAGGATSGQVMTKLLTSPKVIAALGKQGISMKELAKLPPHKITQILGGLTGMVTADQLED